MDPNTNPPNDPFPQPQPGVPPPPPPPLPGPQPPIPPSSPPVGPSQPFPGGGPAEPSPQPFPPSAPTWQPPQYTQPNPIMPGAAPTAPTLGMNDLEMASKKKPARMLAAIAGVVVLALLFGGYFLFFGKKDNTKDAGHTNLSSNATDLATLSNLTINAPPEMVGYKLNDLGVATVKDYSDPTGICDLQFGTLTAAQLPGNNIAEILAPQVKAFRDTGAIIDGPHTHDALLLKDAADAKKQYSMPTMMIGFTQGSKHAFSHYSAVVLKNGNRAFVSRSCVNEKGDIDQNAFKAVDAKALQLTITKQ